MTEANGPGAAEANVRKARMSPVWVIPIVAIAMAGYLGYRTYSEEGPTIKIFLKTADGIEVGKTKVKFKAVEIGSVTDVTVRSEDPQIVVTAQLNKQAGNRAVEGSEFWVVRPRVGAAGISGLGTLLSGAYINFTPGPAKGKRKREFVGLDEPPAVLPGDPRTRFVLHTSALGSLNPGSPVYYRQVEVGEIGSSKLAEDHHSVEVEVLIDPEHATLVRTNSRFWNVGGINFSVGLGKADVQTESLAALLGGGVAFDSPAGGEAAAKDTAFILHESRSKVEDAAWLYGGLHVVVEGAQRGGVKEGDFVYYKEQRVGAVVSTALSNDSRTVRMHLNILTRYAPLVRTNTVFWNASGISADLGLTGLHVHAESLDALIAGGVAFATPNTPGETVKSGSVFLLHPEVKDDWLKWSPRIMRGKEQTHAAGSVEEPKKEHGLGRFFHHEKKTEPETADEAHPKDEEKHGFFHRLLHR